jgi:hypothetical protein
MGAVPDSVKRLVDLSACNAQADRFDQNRKVYRSSDYKEEQLRAEFLNPFFTALGGDMDNKQGLSEAFKQVIHEESIKVTGAPKPRTTPSASAVAAPSSSKPRNPRSTSPPTQVPPSPHYDLMI